jgi:uncharacterized protein (DUF1015 family)
VSTEEARALAEGNPDSFLRVTRPEIELPAGADAAAPAVYARARDNFRRLVQRGVLVRDREPGMFIYRQVRNHRAQAGLVCCAHVDDYASGVIRRHEKTRPDKEDDRTRHTLAINANAGPVFLAFRDDRAVAAAMSADMNDRPLFHFNEPGGVTHTGWAVKEQAPYTRAFAAMPSVYVADGHHRAASAVRAARSLAQANPAHRGDEEYNWFLVTLFPAGDLTILAYNRLVRDLAGQTPAGFLERLRQVGRVQPAPAAVPAAPGAFAVYVAGAWHELTIDPATIDTEDPIASLDVDLLQSRVLDPVLGIRDPRTDQRLEFVGGIRGTAELARRVDAGEAAVAFSLHPTTIEQLLTVADAGLIMPPKSTWFEPKLRSGLFVHELE